MSDLIKVQNMPQFDCYIRWTSLGADSMPDNLIEEGLKQPNHIKIFFEKEACLEPFSQPRDSTTREECAACGGQKVTERR